MNFSLFAVLYIAGMMFYDFTAQSVPVNMCVNFCCSDRFVAQHTLYGAQVGSSFKQVGGKGMAEGVRTDVFGDAGLLCQFLNEMEYHDARDIFAPACQEYIVFEVLLDFPAPLRSTNQFLISLMARDDMGTRRCLLPLPSTLMKPSSKYKSEIFRLHSSDTRRPQLYRVSRMARLRCPSFVPRSMAEMMRSISSTVSTSGSLNPILGPSNSSLGSPSR